MAELEKEENQGGQQEVLVQGRQNSKREKQKNDSDLNINIAQLSSSKRCLQGRHDFQKRKLKKNII